MIRKSIFYFTALCLLIIASASFAQTETELNRLQTEQRRRTQLMQVMDSAVMMMEDENYILAEQKFVYVLNNIKSVPSDLTFYFGKNSYYLNKFRQSVDWLNKYIQLKGTIGQHSEEAVELITKAETELKKERDNQVAKAEQVLSQQYEIDCGPAGKVTCPVCKGTTVLIKKGAFDHQYKTCPYCDQHGNLTCEQYNQLIRGELQPRPQ